MEFSQDFILSNKQKFIDLINSIEREGFKKEELLTKLENSDFYYAPASVKYHNSFKGGLVDHCLCVYNNLKSLVISKHLEETISEDSIKIVSVFHDISKMNFYEEYDKNVKVEGKWVQEKCFKIRDNRFIFGSHEENSYFIASKYIPLTYDESIAIINHMGGMGFDSSQHTVGEVFSQSSLATLLFVADTISTYIDEYE